MKMKVVDEMTSDFETTKMNDARIDTIDATLTLTSDQTTSVMTINATDAMTSDRTDTTTIHALRGTAQGRVGVMLPQ